MASMDVKEIAIAIPILLILAGLLLWVGYEYIGGGIKDIGNKYVKGSCERGLDEYTGICVPSTYSCKKIDGSENPGKFYGGCPSKITKGLVKKEDVDMYNQCCVMETCDSGAGLKKLIYKDLKEDKKLEAASKCMGYAKDCTKEEGCCCVNAQDKK